MIGSYIRIGIRLLILFFRLGIRVIVLAFERKKAVRVFKKTAIANGLSPEQARGLSQVFPTWKEFKPR